MGEPEDFGDTFYASEFLPPPPDDPFFYRVRDFLRRNVQFVRAAEFAIAVAFAGGAWYAGTDMFIVVPGLVFAWIFATAGLIASNLSLRATALWSVTIFVILGSEGAVLYLHYHDAPRWEWLDRWAKKPTEPTFASFTYVPRVSPTTTPPSQWERRVNPKTPWVTAQEIEDQRKWGKTLLTYSPEELLSMSLGAHDMSIYYGNWIKLDYAALDIPQPEKLDKNDMLVLKMYVDSGRLARNGLIVAYFFPPRWRARLLSIRGGDQIKAVCQLRSIQKGPLINSWNFPFDELIAENCDFI
jgi:hypothetical protein